MIAALNEQLEADRAEMAREHEELMETAGRINTTATVGVCLLFCILMCAGLLAGSRLAGTFWERLKN